MIPDKKIGVEFTVPEKGPLTTTIRFTRTVGLDRGDGWVELILGGRTLILNDDAAVEVRDFLNDFLGVNEPLVLEADPAGVAKVKETLQRMREGKPPKPPPTRGLSVDDDEDD